MDFDAPAAFLSDFGLDSENLNICLDSIEPTNICMPHLFKKVIDELCTNKNYAECVELCDTLVNYVWEKLNTGHWKDVKVGWRNLYYLVSLLKTISMTHNEDLERALKVCDKGLILGAPILGDILTKVAQNLHEKIVLKKPPVTETPETNNEGLGITHPPLDHSFDIERIEALSVIDFQLDFLNVSKPVIITGLISHWPAFHDWDISKLQHKMGYRSVPVEIGSSYTDDTWTQKIITVNEFVDRFMKSRNEGIGYLAQHQLFDQIPSLKDDIIIPDYCFVNCYNEESVDINAWFGPAATVSPLHQDPRQNLLCQVVGSKYIRLYDVKYTDSVYPLQNSMMKNTSEVDIEKIDFAKYPLIKDLPYKNCVLSAGEVLFIPKGWWHFVKSLSNSFSVSFWFD